MQWWQKTVKPFILADIKHEWPKPEVENREEDERNQNSERETTQKTEIHMPPESITQGILAEVCEGGIYSRKKKNEADEDLRSGMQDKNE